ncbi:POU domain class 2-associating factor 1 isoform X3 [Homo sapiens]|uniref:POU domain class 2-associating factor 1 isoform X3 n=1 Tax=Homo sapiens TaxID=9606 RepID=UPI0003EB035F|nr:POU domain class 2-associating factor 1 isoform X3 [Homo sapiens]|eukprot:XP_006718923.1 POU domain class 2-associating factor 1 isoform X3 [Homo sapiens]
MSTLQSHYEKHPPSYLLSWSQLQNSLAAGCGHVPGSQETRGSCGSPATSIGRATAPEQAPAPARPYQGVRVKEPVKELLRRKRGHASSGAAPAPTAVVLPHQPLATYTTVGPSCLDMEGSVSAVTEEAALCAGWLSQPTPATLQPLAPWTPYTEYVPHEAVSCPYSADMYVQPVCPSYTVVGPSSVLTYASPPLITNVTGPVSS